MNKDHKLLEEAYQSIYESVSEPLYVGPPKRKEEFLRWLNQLPRTIHPDGSVSVKGDVNLSDLKINRIPFKFKNVTGKFVCVRNKIVSLEGAPESVGDNFMCNHNEINSLEGAPVKVEGSFYCSNNNITSLEGAPKEVGEDFDCDGNNIVSLEGAPEIIKGNFMCYSNNLTSLKGAPKEVGEGFWCSNNNLTSLKGSPKIVGDSFHCDGNPIDSLEGAPEVIGEPVEYNNYYGFHSDRFSDEDYRSFAKKKKYVDGNLSKDLNLDLEDFS